MPWRRPLVLVLSLLCSSAVFGQQTTRPIPSSLPRANRGPLDDLYRFFLESQIYFDKTAAELQQKGRIRDAARHRQYVQSGLHFNATQMAAVRQAAQQMQKDTADAWSKAMPTMLQDRECSEDRQYAANSARGRVEQHEDRRASAGRRSNRQCYCDCCRERE